MVASATLSESTTPPEPVTANDHLLQWRPLILRLAGRRARHLGIDRDDLAQQIHLEALCHFASFDSTRAQFSTWLQWMVKQAIGRIMTERTHHGVAAVSLASPMARGDETLGDLVPDPAFLDHDPAGELDDRLRREAVAGAVAELGHADQAVIRKRFWVDGPLSPTEREHLRSALQNLAEMLEHS